MPYKSEKQRRLMQAAAHNKEFAKKVGVPQAVAREYEMAEKLYPGQGKKKDGKK